MMIENYARVLDMQGIYNLRDIGGYATTDGQTTRWRQILRSDSLHALQAISQKAILDTGLRTIIDLRRPDEVTAEPDVIATVPEITYHNLPIFKAAISAPSVHEMRAVRSLEEVYQAMLDQFQEPLNTVFQTIADAEDGAVLVHCSAGKDRTGVVIALLLDLVNVSAATIVEDYAMTATLLAPRLDAFREKARIAGLDMARHEKMLECRAEAMDTTLKYLHTAYGGAESYLRKIGLTSAQIERLRARLAADSEKA